MDFFKSLFPSNAPTNLGQSILPGWIFANTVSVDENNSSAPDVERSIVSQQSYGRQLGCVIGALTDLIEARPAAERTKGMQELLALSAKIDQIKRQSTEQRLQNLESWLAELKARDTDSYRAVVKRLKTAIDARE
jgi:hypothetical protein